jgi:ribulose bisphosphate carboxylase small subunit
MGHVRTGFLPRTPQWNAIVQQLSLFGGDASVVPIIAHGTLSAIKKIYEVMPFDESVIKAISYLTNLAFSAKQTDQIAYLNSQGYIVDKNLSIFSLVTNAQRLITTENGSLEISKIAKDAAMQAVISYQEKHQSNQIDLFGNEAQNPLRSIGNGAAFCELARSFFAAFTDRQIKYYVERVAASTINNYGELARFTSALSDQSNAIADHAFETSKIMQSFAAGWFNKYADTSLPSDKEVSDFLRTSFGKMREEFRREAGGK